MPSRARGFFPEPVAAKVPEIIFLFWVIKVLTTAGGEATSDYLALDLGSRLEAGCIEAGIFVVALVWQFRTRRYVAAAYWLLAYAIAIFGTGVADAMHLFIGIPYSGTTFLWAAVPALIFWLWYRSERTLSIHSIYTQRRESTTGAWCSPRSRWAPPWATTRHLSCIWAIWRPGSCSCSSS